MPASKEPWFFAEELHERTPPRPEARPRRSSSTRALVRRRRARAARRRGTRRCICGRKRPPPRSPRCSPTRASSRSCASPRASCARCTCSSSRPTSRPSSDLAARARARAGQAPRARDPRHTYWPQRAAVLRARSLRRAAAPLSRRVSRPSRFSCSIYDDFRADNEATVRQVLRFLGVDDTVPVAHARGKPDRAGALAAAERARPRDLGGTRSALAR